MASFQAGSFEKTFGLRRRSPSGVIGSRTTTSSVAVGELLDVGVVVGVVETEGRALVLGDSEGPSEATAVGGALTEGPNDGGSDSTVVGPELVDGSIDTPVLGAPLKVGPVEGASDRLGGTD